MKKNFQRREFLGVAGRSILGMSLSASSLFISQTASAFTNLLLMKKKTGGANNVVFVQQTHNGGTTGSTSPVFGAATTVGHQIIIVGCGKSTQVSSIATTLVASWTQQVALVGTNNEYISIWMGTCTTSGTTIAVTMTASGANAVFALEFSGVSSTIDTSGTLENGSGYVADTGAITTTNANDLVIAAGVQTASGGTESSFSPTPATGWVDLGGVHYGTTGVAQVLGMCAYRIASATASHRMTWTSTNAATCGAAIVAIKST